MPFKPDIVELGTKVGGLSYSAGLADEYIASSLAREGREGNPQVAGMERAFVVDRHW